MWLHSDETLKIFLKIGGAAVYIAKEVKLVLNEVA